MILVPYLLSRCLVVAWARLGERWRRRHLDDGGAGHGGHGGRGGGIGSELVLAA